MATPHDRPDRRRTATTVFWVATGMVALAGVLVPLVVPDPGTTVPPVLSAVLAASFGAAAVVGVLALDRGLTAREPPDDEAAATEVTSRLVLQVAVLEAPALLAVALAAVVGPPWVATVGAAFALIGLVLVRPSDARDARLEARWRAAGAEVRLTRPRPGPGEVASPDRSPDGDGGRAA